MRKISGEPILARTALRPGHMRHEDHAHIRRIGIACVAAGLSAQTPKHTDDRRPVVEAYSGCGAAALPTADAGLICPLASLLLYRLGRQINSARIPHRSKVSEISCNLVACNIFSRGAEEPNKKPRQINIALNFGREALVGPRVVRPAFWKINASIACPPEMGVILEALISGTTSYKRVKIPRYFEAEP